MKEIVILAFAIMVGICVAVAWEAHQDTLLSKGGRRLFSSAFSIMGLVCFALAVLVAVYGD